MMTVRGQNDPTPGHGIGYRAQTQRAHKHVGVDLNMWPDGTLMIGNEVLITSQGELLESAEDPAGAAT